MAAVRAGSAGSCVGDAVFRRRSDGGKETQQLTANSFRKTSCFISVNF